MSREKRLPSGLTYREQRFAELMCKGVRPGDAYVQAGYGDRLKPAERAENANKNAYAKAQQPAIVGYMGQWLARARISDLDSPGAAVSRVLRHITMAEDAENWTALAALDRLAYQHNGIAERTQISVEAVISDHDLLKRIAGEDQAKLGLLTSLLQPATFSPREKRPLLIEGQVEPDEGDERG
jgi:hypothetical protein